MVGTAAPDSIAPENREAEAVLTELDLALAEVDALQPLSDARFLQSHVLYEGRSAQQSRIVDWFADHVDEAAAYRVLSVGCGSGVLDLAILERWHERLPFQPSAPSRRRFRRTSIM